MTKTTALTAAQQGIIDKLRAGAVLASAHLGNRGSGASIQLPGQQAENVRLATLFALQDKGYIVRQKEGIAHSNWTLSSTATEAPTTPDEPKRLTFNLVNEALKSRPGYAGEVLVQGNGYLYFMEGDASAWATGSSIMVCRLNHTTLTNILADFDHFVQSHAEKGSK